MFRQSIYADYPDPDDFMSEQFVPGGGVNSSHYDNPEVTRLLEQGRFETDHGRRESLYLQAEKLLMEDAALVPLYWVGQDILLRPEVTGLKGSPLGVFGIPWEEMSLRR
jgi:oligopeptide transport system substrate-binding protein